MEDPSRGLLPTVQTLRRKRQTYILPVFELHEQDAVDVQGACSSMTNVSKTLAQVRMDRRSWLSPPLAVLSTSPSPWLKLWRMSFRYSASEPPQRKLRRSGLSCKTAKAKPRLLSLDNCSDLLPAIDWSLWRVYGSCFDNRNSSSFTV